MEELTQVSQPVKNKLIAKITKLSEKSKQVVLGFDDDTDEIYDANQLVLTADFKVSIGTPEMIKEITTESEYLSERLNVIGKNISSSIMGQNIVVNFLNKDTRKLVEELKKYR